MFLFCPSLLKRTYSCIFLSMAILIAYFYPPVINNLLNSVFSFNYVFDNFTSPGKQ